MKRQAGTNFRIKVSALGRHALAARGDLGERSRPLAGRPREQELDALRRLAERYQIPVLDHDPGIGGRYSVLTNVGLLPAAIAAVNNTGPADSDCKTTSSSTHQGSQVDKASSQGSSYSNSPPNPEEILQEGISGTTTI